MSEDRFNYEHALWKKPKKYVLNLNRSHSKHSATKVDL